MANWHYMDVNKNMVKYDTGKAMLIACPSSSEYAGYCFWHPNACIREGRHSAAYCISFTEDWEFKLKNKDTDDEVKMDYHELSEVMACLNCEIDYDKKKANPFETHVPKKLKAEKTEVLDDLLDN